MGRAAHAFSPGRVPCSPTERSSPEPVLGLIRERAPWDRGEKAPQLPALHAKREPPSTDVEDDPAQSRRVICRKVLSRVVRMSWPVRVSTESEAQRDAGSAPCLVFALFCQAHAWSAAFEALWPRVFCFLHALIQPYLSLYLRSGPKGQKVSYHRLASRIGCRVNSPGPMDGPSSENPMYLGNQSQPETNGCFPSPSHFLCKGCQAGAILEQPFVSGWDWVSR